jgi:hypothetical protein
VSGNAAACVIDCENYSVSAFRFLGDEGPLATLQDVTITRSYTSEGALDLDDAGGTVVIAGEVLESDPMFCAAAACGAPTTEGVYTLDWISPASTVDCGPMGALGAGCEAPTPVRSNLEVRSWGSIKNLYR